MGVGEGVGDGVGEGVGSGDGVGVAAAVVSMTVSTVSCFAHEEVPLMRAEPAINTHASLKNLLSVFILFASLLVVLDGTDVDA